MTIDAVRSRDIQSNLQDAEPSEQKQKLEAQHAEPDFTSAVYATVHLPTGLLPHATTIATVAKDVVDLRANVAKVAADLRSPDLMRLVHADAKLYAAYVEFNASFLPLVKTLAVDRGPALLFGLAVGVVAIAKGVPDAIERMQTAHAEALKAAPAARPAVMQLFHDLAAMQASGIKLATDVKRLGGV